MTAFTPKRRVGKPKGPRPLVKAHRRRFPHLHPQPTFPIQCLPNELLVNVFNLVEDCNYTNNAKTVLHRLALVCTRWRDLLLGCTTLWSDIVVDITHRVPRDGDVSMIDWDSIDAEEDLWTSKIHHRLQLALQRSGSQPLDIAVVSESAHFRTIDDFVINELVRVATVRTCISPHLGRVRSLRVAVVSGVALHELSTLAGEASSLAELSLSCNSHLGGPEPSRPLLHAPSLRSLILSAPSCLHRETFEVWNTVQTLVLTDYGNNLMDQVTPVVLLRMLAFLPNLVNLTIVHMENDLFPRSSVPAVLAPANVALPQLKLLTFVRMCPVFILQFVQNMKASSLEGLYSI